MAYKNMKSNKRHIKELRKDPGDFYNKGRKRKRREESKVDELSFEDMEKMIKKSG